MSFVSFVAVVVAAANTVPCCSWGMEQLHKAEEVQHIYDKGKCQIYREHRYDHITAWLETSKHDHSQQKSFQVYFLNEVVTGTPNMEL